MSTSSPVGGRHGRAATMRIKLLLRLVLSAIFVYAGILKIVSPLRFITDISNYHLLPWFATIALAFYLPWLEVIAGLALLWTRVSRGALLLLSLLTCVFIIASLVAKARGLDVTCGCFGHVSKDWSFGRHLLLDFAMLGALIFCALPAKEIYPANV